MVAYSPYSHTPNLLRTGHFPLHTLMYVRTHTPHCACTYHQTQQPQIRMPTLSGRYCTFVSANAPTRPLTHHRRTNHHRHHRRLPRSFPGPTPDTRALRSHCVLLRRYTSPYVLCKDRVLRFFSFSSAGRSTSAPAAPRSLSCKATSSRGHR